MKLKEILDKIEYISYKSDLDLEIDNIVSINDSKERSNVITWCGNKNVNQLIDLKTDAIIIVSKELDRSVNKELNYLVVDNPRRTFQKILVKFFCIERKKEIHSTAFIDKSSKIGDNVFIGHNVIVEENCIIGNNVTILHNTVILRDTLIGDNVSIGSNNTIGGIGFGYEKNIKGDFELIPHIGNVVIRKNVDIGNNTCIDRAVMGSTILEENVKVDNLVHIAHGVHVKRNAVVIANAMVAGSVTIGENSWIAPSSSIINKKNIGADSLVGLGAVVTKNVKDGVIVAGNPAKFIRDIEKK